MNLRFPVEFKKANHDGLLTGYITVDINDIMRIYQHEGVGYINYMSTRGNTAATEFTRLMDYKEACKTLREATDTYNRLILNSQIEWNGKQND